MTVKKDFFIENNSSWSVYYKLYFDNVSGSLSDTLEVTIKYGDTVLCSGTPSSLTRTNITAAEEMLQVGAKKTLSIYFFFPDEIGNEAQNLTLSFDM